MGQYNILEWTKDSQPLIESSLFHHFKEIYIVENTTSDLLGFYRVQIISLAMQAVQTTFEVAMPGIYAQ